MARWWEDADTLARLRQVAETRARQNIPGVTGPDFAKFPTPGSTEERGLPLPQAARVDEQAALRQQAEARAGEARARQARAQQVTEQARRAVALAETGGTLPAVSDFTQRAGEAWRGVSAPREEAQLPKIVPTVKPEAAIMPKPGLVATAPAVLLARRPEQGEGLFGGNPLARIGEVAGAAWHDVKQAPGLVGAIPRGLEATGKTVLEALQAPAATVENLLGQAVTGVSAPTGLTLEQQALLSGVAGTSAMIPYAPASAPGAAPTLARTLAAETGATPEQAEAAVQQAGRVTYSGPAAMEAVARRVLAGEGGQAAAQGRAVNVSAPTAEDQQAYQVYLRGVAARGGDVEEAARRVQQTGYIPGEAKLVPELVGQAIMDPLNLFDVAGKGQQVARAVGQAERSLGAVPEARRAVEAATDVARQAERDAEAAGRLGEAVREAVQQVAPAGERGWLGRAWEKVNPFRFTDEAVARRAANEVGVVVGGVVADAPTGQEAAARVAALVNEPERLRPLLGSVPEWAATGRTRERLAQVAAEVPTLPSVKAADFNPAQFTLELDDLLMKALRPAERAQRGGVLGKYEALVGNVQGLLSEFYLRTPGYAVRNALGDLVTLAYDGLATTDRWDDVAGYLRRFGPTTPRVERAIRGGAQGAQELAEVGESSRVGRLVGGLLGEKAGEGIGGAISKVQGRIGQVLGTGEIAGRRTLLGEETRYARGFQAALARAWGRVWRPRVPEELARTMGPARAAALEDGLRRAVNTPELEQAVARALGDGTGGLLDLTEYLGPDVDHLSAELARRMDEVLRTAGSREEAVARLEALAAEAEQAAYVSGDVLPPVRRVHTAEEAAQDAAEQAAALERLGQASGADAQEIQQATAEALAQAERQAGEQAAAEARLMETAAKRLAEPGADDRAIKGVLLEVRAKTQEAHLEGRSLHDALRAETWRRYREAGRPEPGLWERYWQQARAIREEEHTRVVALLDEAAQVVERGEVPGGTANAAEAWLRKYRGQAEELAGRERRIALAAADDFETALGKSRLAVDGAQHEAWRVGLLNPSQEALDTLATAEADVQRIGGQAAAEAERLRSTAFMKRKPGQAAGEAWAETQKKIDEVWRRCFAEQQTRFDLARGELLRLPLGEAAQRKLLQELGWPAEAAQQVNRETALAALQARARWDPVLDAPVVPMQELQEVTLPGLAEMIGLDASDPRRVTEAQWQQVARFAQQRADLYDALRTDVGTYYHAAVTGAETTPERLARVQEAAARRAADPGVLERWQWMGERLRELRDEALARADAAGMIMGQRIATIPEGAARVEQKRLGGVYLVRVLDEDGVTLAEVAHDNLPDAREEARWLTEQVRKGAGVPRDWVPVSVAEAAQRLGVQADDWREWERAADALEVNGTEVLRRGDEYGRQGIAAQEAKRLREETPTTMQRGGEYVEVYQRRGAMSAAREQARVRELTREAKELAERTTGQALKRFGLTPDEIAGLSLEQRRKVLEEFAEGRVVMTDAGKPRQIDGLDAARRQLLVEQVYRSNDEALRALAQGMAADPLTAPGYQMLDVAQQMRTRADDLLLQGAGMTADEIAEARRVDPEGLNAYAQALRGAQAGAVDAGEMARAEQAVAGVFEEWTPEEVAKAGEQWGTAVQPPTLAELADVAAQQQRRLVERVKAGVMQQWDGMAEAAGQPVPPWVQAQVKRWVTGEVARAQREARPVAVEAARQMADTALLDYSQRRRIDTWLGLVAPYTYWSTRSGRNWAIRLAQNPATLANYIRYKRTMEEANQRRGYRSRFEGAVEVPVGKVLPEWMGGAVFVDPASIFFPFANLEPNEWDEPGNARNGVDFLYRTLSKYGFKPYGFLEKPLTQAGIIGEPVPAGEKMGTLEATLRGLPPVRVAEQMRALMQTPGRGPAPALGASGPKLQEWDTYRVGRQVANLAAEGGDTRVALTAQELARQVGLGQIGAAEAIGQAAGGNVERLAQVSGWTPEQLSAAQALLAEAWRRTQQEAAVGGLTSTLLGVPLRVYPGGERQQVAAQREMAGAAYSPLTGQGSRAEYEAFRQARPETYTRSAVGGLTPAGLAGQQGGTVAGERMTPGEYEKMLREKAERQASKATLEQEQWATLRAKGLGATLPQAESTGTYTAAETWGAPYGSTPAEAAASARRAALGAVSGALPKRADYTDAAEYEQAVAEFWRRGVAGVKFPAGLPADATKGITKAEVEAYWRGNDTLPEALTRAFAEWYGQQWEAYKRAAPTINDGMTKDQKSAAYAARDAAWARYVDEGRLAPGAVAQQMATLYPGRWSREEVLAALRGVKLPGVRETWLGRMTPEERKQTLEDERKRTAQGEFWETFGQLPSGATWKETRGNPLVALVLDKDTRGTVTAEQYEMAAALLKAWLEKNGGATAGKGAGTTTGGGTRTSGGKRTSGGGGYVRGGAPAARSPGDWGGVQEEMSGGLSRQLADLFLRETPLDEGALREVDGLMARYKWKGTRAAFLEWLRSLFKQRRIIAGAPKRYSSSYGRKW